MRESKYYSGAADLADKPRRYLTDARKMQTLLLNGDIHVKLWTFEVLWISDRPAGPNEYRMYALIQAGRVHADNDGFFVID